MSDDERPIKKMKRDPEDESGSDSGGSDDDDGGAVIGPNGKKVKGKGGSSCHQCKSRRNFTALTYCTSNLDKKNKKCRKKFCGHCLKKFYKENVHAIVDKTTWKCPSCRKICCCAACRRRKTKEGNAKDSSDMSPAHGHGHKTKKSSSHKSAHRDHHGGAAYGHGGHGGHRYGDDAYGSGATNDEGYPLHSTSHRRGDRSLMHGSPRGGMHGGHMGDSPMRSYDMEGGERRGGHHSSEYDDSDGGNGSYSSSDDSGGSSSDDDGGHPRRSHHSGPSAELADGNDDAPSLPSSHFTTMLSSHIKQLAEESARNADSPFARLYAQAQQMRVKKKIKAILVRPDLKKEKKVELIAALLQPLAEEGHAHPHPNQGATMQQHQQQQQQQQQYAASAAAAPMQMQHA